MRPVFRTSLLSVLERRRDAALRNLRECAKNLCAAENPLSVFSAATIEASATAEAYGLVHAALAQHPRVTLSPLATAEVVARCTASVSTTDPGDTVNGYVQRALCAALRSIDVEALLREARRLESPAAFAPRAREAV